MHLLDKERLQLCWIRKDYTECDNAFLDKERLQWM